MQQGGKTEMEKIFPSVINLNVGGMKFTTRLNTLQKYPDSMLATMFSGRHNIEQDNDGHYFIDRNGKNFEHILDFLRDDQYMPPSDVREDVLRDAEYFCLSLFVEHLKTTPPLFPFHIVLQNNRDSVKDYFEIKKQVIDIAKLGVSNFGSNNIAYSNSQVVIETYKSMAYRKPPELQNFRRLPPRIKEVKYFEEVEKCLAEMQYKDITIFIEKEKIENFASFIDTLVYDINQEGFNVLPEVMQTSETSCPTRSFRPSSDMRPTVINKRVVFNDHLYTIDNYAHFTFKWLLLSGQE